MPSPHLSNFQHLKSSLACPFFLVPTSDQGDYGPTLIPLATRLAAIEISVLTLRLRGIPKTDATGTASGLSLPATEAANSAGRKPWIKAPIATPITMNGSSQWNWRWKTQLSGLPGSYMQLTDARLQPGFCDHLHSRNLEMQQSPPSPVSTAWHLPINIFGVRLSYSNLIPQVPHRCRYHSAQILNQCTMTSRTAPQKYCLATSKIYCNYCPGYCCYSLEGSTLFLDSDDINRIARHYKITDGEVRKRYIQQKNTFQTRPDGSCIFLSNERMRARCTIHQARPRQCREFPYDSSCPYLEREDLLRQIQPKLEQALTPGDGKR